jgi:hypothetical protein
MTAGALRTAHPLVGAALAAIRRIRPLIGSLIGPIAAKAAPPLLPFSSTPLGATMRALLTLLALVSLSAPLPALAAGLNDTGVTTCYNGSSLVACDSSNTGNSAAYPRQDARFGRDAAQAAGLLPAKTGGGAAGFDFTPLDAVGTAIALTGTPPVPSATPACVHDNVTNLTWEVKTAANKSFTYNFAAAATYASDTNTAGLCGTGNLWRVPTRRELLSIVHHGTYSPAIDLDYFPNTDIYWFWTSDVYVHDLAFAWSVYFGYGYADANGRSSPVRVRLVRSGL